MTLSPSESVREFAASELFERTFQEGMDLVEEAAAYLDGDGRRDSKLLSRDAALAYAGESMRLTTRLMQVASWLLVQRAVRQGDMTADAAREPRYRVGDPAPAGTPRPAAAAPLPATLTGLAERSERLFERVSKLDRRMYGEAGEAGDDANAVLAQFERLRAAFG